MRVVEIPAEMNVVAEYPVAFVARSPHRELATQFVALLTGPEGQAALTRAGFGPPAPVAGRWGGPPRRDRRRPEPGAGRRAQRPGQTTPSRGRARAAGAPSFALRPLPRRGQ